jgi:hypothetical protein
MQSNAYSDEELELRYYYQTQKKNISLEGKMDKDGNIKVQTPDRGDPRIAKEEFDLKKTKTGYTGIWKSGKKSLPVTFTKISADNSKHPFRNLPGIRKLKIEDPLEYVKTSTLSFIKDSQSLAGPANIEWYKEKFSGTIFPRLKSGYPAAAMKKINEVLLETHLMESINYLNCSSQAYGEYNVNAGSLYGNKNVFALKVTVSYHCGGAHPDFGEKGLNFDAQTGDHIQLDDLLWFGKTRPPEPDSDKWYEYRNKIFAPKLVELLKAEYPEEMKPPAPESENECDYSDSEVWDYPNWYFTEKGIYFGAVFPRVARNCDSPDWSILPYEVLKKYLNPSLKLKLL